MHTLAKDNECVVCVKCYLTTSAEEVTSVKNTPKQGLNEAQVGRYCYESSAAKDERTSHTFSCDSS